LEEVLIRATELSTRQKTHLSSKLLLGNETFYE